LRSIGAVPRDVGLVAVDVGPGSFTGLRIGVTFAKTFAYATGANILGVTSMEVLAHQAAKAHGSPILRLWTLVDAHRGQLFAALYKPAGDGATRCMEACDGPEMMEADRWLAKLRPRDLVTGPVAQRLASRLPAEVDLMEADARTPSARGVAEVAWQHWQRGDRDDLWKLRPFYIRQSAAEERRTMPGAN
jgi:tRNA threonylcarbamoyladenosine biosynthesis protein TsaB